MNVRLLSISAVAAISLTCARTASAATAVHVSYVAPAIVYTPPRAVYYYAPPPRGPVYYMPARTVVVAPVYAPPVRAIYMAPVLAAPVVIVR